ncbi:hypothetical protein VP01_867g1 [Puccinia sorghi]|uniref:Uncharacterized protein n=1 Tax=Puccinia sorghi TaxID=27349 RepID=A0A0L6U9H3_9BASI|nr:hypothetical protein VP01_867g1 [Puccinia sorghi]
MMLVFQELGPPPAGRPQHASLRLRRALNMQPANPEATRPQQIQTNGEILKIQELSEIDAIRPLSFLLPFSPIYHIFNSKPTQNRCKRAFRAKKRTSTSSDYHKTEAERLRRLSNKLTGSSAQGHNSSPPHHVSFYSTILYSLLAHNIFEHDLIFFNILRPVSTAPNYLDLFMKIRLLILLLHPGQALELTDHELCLPVMNRTKSWVYQLSTHKKKQKNIKILQVTFFKKRYSPGNASPGEKIRKSHRFKVLLGLNCFIVTWRKKHNLHWINDEWFLLVMDYLAEFLSGLIKPAGRMISQFFDICLAHMQIRRMEIGKINLYLDSECEDKSTEPIQYWKSHSSQANSSQHVQKLSGCSGFECTMQKFSQPDDTSKTRLAIGTILWTLTQLIEQFKYPSLPPSNSDSLFFSPLTFRDPTRCKGSPGAYKPLLGHEYAYTPSPITLCFTREENNHHDSILNHHNTRNGNASYPFIELNFFFAQLSHVTTRTLESLHTHSAIQLAIHRYQFRCMQAEQLGDENPHMRPMSGGIDDFYSSHVNLWNISRNMQAMGPAFTTPRTSPYALLIKVPPSTSSVSSLRSRLHPIVHRGYTQRDGAPHSLDRSCGVPSIFAPLLVLIFSQSRCEALVPNVSHKLLFLYQETGGCRITLSFFPPSTHNVMAIQQTNQSKRKHFPSGYSVVLIRCQPVCRLCSSENISSPMYIPATKNLGLVVHLNWTWINSPAARHIGQRKRACKCSWARVKASRKHVLLRCFYACLFMFGSFIIWMLPLYGLAFESSPHCSSSQSLKSAGYPSSPGAKSPSPL